MSQNGQFDALLIGAGPSGSTAAALLAEHGHNVLLIEREKFPRYHIGESLLPFTFEPLKRLGLIERMRASAFIKKYSVQFISTSGRASQPFYFNTRYDDDVAQTWQVLRSEFDQMLLDHARDKGANVVEETEVLELLRDGDRVTGVRVRQSDGTEAEYRAPITLDCSGKESFAASRNRWRVRDPELNKVAVWTYYKGAKRDKGIDEGMTTVAFLPEKGWFWYIPLHDDRVSVGAVAEGKYLTRGGVRSPRKSFTVRSAGTSGSRNTSHRASPPVTTTSPTSFHITRDTAAAKACCCSAMPTAFSIPFSRPGSCWHSRAGCWPPTRCTRPSRPMTSARRGSRATPPRCARASRTCASWCTPSTTRTSAFAT